MGEVQTDQDLRPPSADRPVTSYIPPYPARPKTELASLRLVLKARRNLVAIWPEDAFKWEFFATKVLKQSIFVANSPDLVKSIWIDKSDIYHSKTVHQRNALRPVLGDGLLISDGEVWRQRRPIVAQTTHASRMRQLTPVITTVTAELLQRWRALKPGAQVNISTEMGELAAEIICRSIFGRQLRPGSARTIVDGFTSYQAIVNQIDVPTLFGLAGSKPPLVRPSVRRSAASIRAVVAELVDETLNEPQAGADTSLLRAIADQAASPANGGVDRTALIDEATVLFLAGHETSANTLAWAWYLLSQAPWAADALRQEAQAVLGDRVAGDEDVPRLVYTRAVVQEVLRLYPPIPVQAREAQTRDRVRNREIRPGSVMILVPWLLHRHKKLWRDPDAFEPERWLPGGDGAPSRYAYVPFGIGPRVCSGAAFAMTEVVICLASLAANFSLTPCKGHTVSPVCRLTLRPGDTLPMILRPAVRAGA